MSRLSDHVEAFNHAVTSGDWQTFAERFADDAVMTFVGVPAGPFRGRVAIAAAYCENPPTETMTLLDEDHQGSAHFRWTSGSTGIMHLTWTPTETIQTLTVTFDDPS
jgi:steroid delta-isomerase